jgi:hypothetical protein
VWQAFTHARTPGLLRRAAKLEQCCRYPALRAKPDGELIVCPQRCRDRCCPHCSTYRARETGARAVEAARRFDSARLLTLTVPHVDDFLPDQIAAIRAAFGRLRRSASWRQHVRGGVYGFEVKLSATDSCWHPHLHVIADGEFYPRDELREAWRAALNHPKSPWKIAPSDPLIVDARYVRNRSDVASYVAKYVAKAADLASWPPPFVREFAISMAGQRLLNTFGSMHGAKLDPRDANDDPAATTHVASITTLNIAAGRGQHTARVALLLFRLAFPKLSQWTRRDITEVPPDTLRDGESVPNALARVALLAEREFWARIEGTHWEPTAPGSPKKPPPRTLPLPYDGREDTTP